MAVMAHLRTRRASFTVAGLTAFAVAGALCLSGVAPAGAAECSDTGAVIIVAGTNDPESAHLVGVTQRYTGKMPTVVDGDVVIVDDPDSDYLATPKDVIYVDYPTTLWPLGAAGYDDSTTQGRSATASAIAGYQARCGVESDIVVAGYSQGARVAGDVLADIGNGRAEQMVATDENGEVMLDENGEPILVTIEPGGISGELYSDPRRAGDKTGRGIELSLIGIIPGLTMSGPRGKSETDSGFGELEGEVVSVCIDGDPICDLPDPIHDPIGAIDGLLGYFTKHSRYPFQMYRDPKEPAWNDGRAVECDPETAVCIVAADSAFAELIQDWARDLGYRGTIGDFLSGRPTIDLPYGIELANLQPVVRLVQDLLPPLPKLGYGAYLPDLFVFEDILEGILTLSPAQFVGGARALAASLRSIVLLPVNFVRYWTGAIIGPVASEGGAVTILAADTSHLRSSTFARLAAVPDESVGPVRAEEVGGSGPSSEPSAARAAEPDATDPSPAEQPPVGDTTDTSSGADTGDDAETDTPDADPAPAPPRDDDSPAVTDPSGSDVETSGTDGHGGEDGERAGSSDTASDPDGPSPDPSEPDSDGGSEAGD
ncbi:MULTISPECIES: PE-PPE domain-containing protein [unclassified Gordonia (in: high G+C Gram-positive bacteria)]|uniref:cutinase family protein n=1 Tax=unclassified Gordonia (in: high G+C Gram-positive bacteria) TaxID=2657482 RepID=UPI0010F976AA|nr:MULTISPECIES: PE-PPE domain-containing protein [unclassified Gordonia (in: high G+C Gram-positive bacteria)]